MGLLGANALIEVVPGLMIWTIVCFLATFFVLKRFAFGPIQKMIDERRQKIRESLTDAEEIRQEVRRDAEALRERAREEVEEDRRRRLEETKRQIDAETQRALGAIRAEVADLTLIATSKVTGKVLTDADQRRLIDEAIESLDFSQLEKPTA